MTQQREHWGSRIGFIFAAAGSAIGLGSLWKFPKRSEEHTSELQSRGHLVCRLLLEKKKIIVDIDVNDIEEVTLVPAHTNVIVRYLVLCLFCKVGVTVVSDDINWLIHKLYAAVNV